MLMVMRPWLAVWLLVAFTTARAEDMKPSGPFVFLGDSIMAGGGWQRLTGRADTVNAAAPAEKTADILQRVGDVARPDDPSRGDGDLHGRGAQYRIIDTDDRAAL